jgi:hypothetical protein
MTTMPVSVELETATIDRLAERERETGLSRSQLAQQYIEEGLRMARHPGIVFRDGPTGRRAALIDGPDVWEVISAVWDVRGDEAEVLQIAETGIGITSFAARAALQYYEAYRDEIDDRVISNRVIAAREEAAWRAARGLPPA